MALRAYRVLLAENHDDSHGTELSTRRRAARNAARWRWRWCSQRRNYPTWELPTGSQETRLWSAMSEEAPHEPPALMPACGLGG